MKRILALACATMIAAPAMAGDQPVIITKPPVFEIYDFPIYTLSGTSGVGTGVTTRGNTTTISPAAASPAQGRVGGVALTSAESDALYARLLAEAKQRKLR